MFETNVHVPKLGNVTVRATPKGTPSRRSMFDPGDPADWDITYVHFLDGRDPEREIAFDRLNARAQNRIENAADNGELSRAIEEYYYDCAHEEDYE